MADRRSAWEALAADQHGVVSRAQLLGCGLSGSAVRWLVRDRRWPCPSPGVYITFTGPPPWRTLAWAAILAAGRDAVLVGRSALYLHRVLDAPGDLVEVAVPAGRHPRRRPGTVVTRRRDRAAAAGNPPRIGVEVAVLDVAGAAPVDADAVALVLAAVQRRRTTPARLRGALASTPRHPRRRLLVAVLSDADAGTHSLLERRYLTDVERAHGLPRAERNRPETERDVHGGGARRRYRDVCYVRFRLVVELDGRSAHPGSVRGEDERRDNLLLVVDVVTLRYGWVDVVGRPCEVAAEVAAVLRRRGWDGALRPCGPGCTAVRT